MLPPFLSLTSAGALPEERHGAPGGILALLPPVRPRRRIGWWLTGFMVTGAVPLVVALLTAGASAADFFPYFKADTVVPLQVPIAAWEPPREYTAAPAHPIATECAVDDRACLGTHDRHVLDLALFSGGRATCARATRPDSCSEAYRMITGDTDPAPRWAGLDDPCTLVVRVDSGVATLYNPRTTETRRTTDIGWHAGGYVGACDVSALNLKAEPSVGSLPRFPWQSPPGH